MFPQHHRLTDNYAVDSVPDSKLTTTLATRTTLTRFFTFVAVLAPIGAVTGVPLLRHQEHELYPVSFAKMCLVEFGGNCTRSYPGVHRKAQLSILIFVVSTE